MPKMGNIGSDLELALEAAKIRAARALLGWDQTELARRVRISRSALSDLELGKRRPHAGTSYLLEKTFTDAGVQFAELGVFFNSYPPTGRQTEAAT